MMRNIAFLAVLLWPLTGLAAAAYVVGTSATLIPNPGLLSVRTFCNENASNKIAICFVSQGLSCAPAIDTAGSITIGPEACFTTSPGESAPYGDVYVIASGANTGVTILPQ